MLDDQRPGTVYWIDHYVVGSDDLDRWADFEAKVIGAQPQPAVGPPGPSCLSPAAFRLSATLTTAGRSSR